MRTKYLAKDPTADISLALLDLFTIQIPLLKLQEVKINKKWQWEEVNAESLHYLNPLLKFTPIFFQIFSLSQAAIS